MTDDLVKRLREAARQYVDNEYNLHARAAERIKALEAALKRIAAHDMQAIAMDALRPGERVREKVK